MRKLIFSVVAATLLVQFLTTPSSYAVPLSNPTPVCTTSCIINFTYQSANYYEWTAPASGTYTFQAWGAQGGGGTSYYGAGGAGGYSKGDVTISAGTTIYVYVGQAGFNSGTASNTAFNGGGAGNPTGSASSSGFSGGGATHAATQVGLLSSLSATPSSVLVVAGGGGGGAGSTSNYVGYTPAGGVGGGLTGGTPADSAVPSIRGKGSPGTQSAAGASGLANDGVNESPLVAASFGLGASSNAYTGDAIQGGGGGGGWYGGGAGSHRGGAGAGGSGYVGNLTNTTIADGATSFIQPDGSTSIGRLGSGYLRITYPLPTVTFSGYSLSGTLSKGIFNTVTATVSMSSKITFLANGKRIAGCVSKSTTGSGPYTATCNWKPSTRGTINLSFYIQPLGGTVEAIRTGNNQVKVSARSNNR